MNAAINHYHPYQSNTVTKRDLEVDGLNHPPQYVFLCLFYSANVYLRMDYVYVHCAYFFSFFF
jgi:hypothetical protein